MTKIIATFSNGFTDKYNGTRDVKAAWLITKIEDGSVYASGHSLNLDTAAKTAKSSIPRAMQTYNTSAPMNPGYLAAVMALYVRPAGCKSIREYNTLAKATNAAKAAKYKIEIINL